MAKVKYPLLSGDALGAFGKQVIFTRGGRVRKYFEPRNPRTEAQEAHRAWFLEKYMAKLSKEQADLLYAALVHYHDEVYSGLGHGHVHADLAGLDADDHLQYLTAGRADLLYLPVDWVGKSIDVLGTHLLGATVPAATTYYSAPWKASLNGTGNQTNWPVGGVLRRLVATIGTQPGSGSLEVTLEVGGSATALKVTFPAGGGGTLIDTTHQVNFSAGSGIRFAVKNNAAAASGSFGVIAVQLVSDLA